MWMLCLYVHLNDDRCTSFFVSHAQHIPTAVQRCPLRTLSLEWRMAAWWLQPPLLLRAAIVCGVFSELARVLTRVLTFVLNLGARGSPNV